MTTEELRAYGRKLAEQSPPLPDRAIDAAAAIYAAAVTTPEIPRAAG